MPHDRNPSPGELVRRVRERHHVTQKELAQRAHTAQSAISRIECDRISPTVDTLSGLLRALGEELMLEARPGGRPVVLRARVLDSEESRSEESRSEETNTARSA
jgi:transcriptional regulator with XRE-family HTH domain